MYGARSEDASRLRTLILFDAFIAATAAAFIVVVYLAVERSVYLVVLAAMVTGSGMVMLGGLRPLSREDIRAATAWLAIANWCIAISATAIATFAWPLMMLAALLPSVVAASFLAGRQLRWYLATSLAVSLAVVLVGLLQDFSGLSEQVPRWVRQFVLVFFAPFLGGLVVLVASQNSIRLQAALNEALESQGALAAQAEELRLSRARVVAATDRERRRIERDLHDGAQQRLVAMGMRLARAARLCHDDPGAAVEALDELRGEIHVAHDELRNLAQGVYPPVLSQHGLAEALRSAADRCAIPVQLRFGEVGRHSADLEAAIYFCCVEALQNAAKHSQASSVCVVIGVDTTRLWFEVSDDGIGFDPSVLPAGSGLLNMQDRIGAIGGELLVQSVPGARTTVVGSIPLSHSDHDR